MILNLSEVHVVSGDGKNNQRMLADFVETDVVEFFPRWKGGEAIVRWKEPLAHWENFVTIDAHIVLPHPDGGERPIEHIGAFGMICTDRNRDGEVCLQVEHLKAAWVDNGREIRETAWNMADRLHENGIVLDTTKPIYFVAAGPWRGVSDRPEYRHRTNISRPFDYATLEPWDDDKHGGGDEPPVEPPPEPNADYEELAAGVVALADDLAGDIEDFEASNKKRRRRLAKELRPIVDRLRDLVGEDEEGNE